MNKYVRVTFLPIMILAGIFTCTVCFLITAPIAVCHWWREKKLIPLDYSKDEEYLRQYHQELEDTKLKS